jgi:hypothetical protein
MVPCSPADQPSGMTWCTAVVTLHEQGFVTSTIRPTQTCLPSKNLPIDMWVDFKQRHNKGTHTPNATSEFLLLQCRTQLVSSSTQAAVTGC